jgi:hypothetical protein
MLGFWTDILDQNSSCFSGGPLKTRAFRATQFAQFPEKKKF